VTSGWMMDRIVPFVARMESSCNGKDWVLP
jgi:hypothetical protein